MKNEDPQSHYDDIINLERPRSRYLKMPLENRAAQFAPFAALTSYHEKITEAEDAEFYSGQEIIYTTDT